MSLVIVTSGYLNTVILILALYLAIKSGKVLPLPLDDRKEVNPVVVLNIERLLATAMALGLFVVAMLFVFAPAFSAGVNLNLTAVMP